MISKRIIEKIGKKVRLEDSLLNTFSQEKHGHHGKDPAKAVSVDQGGRS